DVRTQAVGARVDLASGFGGQRIGVDTDAREVVAEARLHERAARMVERTARRAQRLADGARNRRDPGVVERAPLHRVLLAALLAVRGAAAARALPAEHGRRRRREGRRTTRFVDVEAHGITLAVRARRTPPPPPARRR